MAEELCKSVYIPAPIRQVGPVTIEGVVVLATEEALDEHGNNRDLSR